MVQDMFYKIQADLIMKKKIKAVRDGDSLVNRMVAKMFDKETNVIT